MNIKNDELKMNKESIFYDDECRQLEKGQYNNQRYKFMNRSIMIYHNGRT